MAILGCSTPSLDLTKTIGLKEDWRKVMFQAPSNDWHSIEKITLISKHVWTSCSIHFGPPRVLTTVE